MKSDVNTNGTAGPGASVDKGKRKAIEESALPSNKRPFVEDKEERKGKSAPVSKKRLLVPVEPVEEEESYDEEQDESDSDEVDDADSEENDDDIDGDEDTENLDELLADASNDLRVGRHSRRTCAKVDYASASAFAKAGLSPSSAWVEPVEDEENGNDVFEDEGTENLDELFADATNDLRGGQRSRRTCAKVDYASASALAKAGLSPSSARVEPVEEEEIYDEEQDESKSDGDDVDDDDSEENDDEIDREVDTENLDELLADASNDLRGNRHPRRTRVKVDYASASALAKAGLPPSSKEED